MSKRYDVIQEVDKGIDHIEHVEKFNPYHDERGRFASASGYSSFTFRTKDPAKQHMADMAVAREKERAAAGAGAGAAGEKRIADAEESMRAMLREGADVNFKGMDPELAESTANQVKTVLERYPTVKDAFGGFVMEEPRPGYWEEKPNTYACYSPATEKIHFNPSVYADKTSYEARYQKSVESKFSPAGTTADSAVVHEMGHAIDRYVSLKTIDPWKVRWGGETVSSRLWNNDIKNAKKRGEAVTTGSITEGLCRYASKNPHEYIAEGFSEYITSPNPRPMAQSIGKRLETYIKKAAKAE